MIKVRFSDGIMELPHCEIIKEEGEYAQAQLLCGRCKKWIATLFLKYIEPDLYTLVYSICSSDYVGLENECRVCEEG